MTDRAGTEPPPATGASLEGDIAVLVSNRQDLPVDEAELSSLAGRTLSAEGLHEGELSLSFVETPEMEELHQRYAGEPGPTDVLSFPIGEDGLLGDVVICPEEARRNNPDMGSELRLLVVHGVLHLLGYDHEREEDRRVMWAKQTTYSGVEAP
jgi:probable rRNA maturation factor